MQYDYRKTVEGKRRFGNKAIYAQTLEFQKKMAEQGVAWHNHFSDECTIDFCCCQGDGKYEHHIPSFTVAIKQAFAEYYEEIKAFDVGGKMKIHMQKFLNDNY